jgi:hypothetical protein
MNSISIKKLLFFVLLPMIVSGQKTSFWETKLFFEDGLGNKDSITIGHDLESKSNYNPDYGEINIKDVPWNSVFEVRASHNEPAHNIASPHVLSKKIVGSTEAGLHPTYNCLFVREPLKAFVRIKNMPLKISWDSTRHDGFCNKKDFLTPHILPLIFPNWNNDPEFVKNPPYVCLSEKQTFVIDNFTKNTNGFFDYILDLQNDGSIDTIYGLLISFRTESSSNSPCSGTVNVFDIVQQDLTLNVFPNPTSNFINLESTETLPWELFDYQGRLIKSGQELIFNIQDFKNGLYFLKVKINNRIVVKKIIKSG